MAFSRRVHRMGRRVVAPRDTHRLSGASDIIVTASGTLSDFEPTDVAGCKIWLRADLGITLNGATVSDWANQADAATLVSVAQAVPGKQPTYRASGINGLPDLDFDGVDDFLKNMFVGPDLAQPLHMFAVLSPDVDHTGFPVTSGHDTKRCQFRILLAGQVLYMSGGVDLSGGSYVAATPYLHEGVFNGVTSELFKDGTSVASGDAGAEATSGLVVGDYDTAVSPSPVAPFDGKIPELIVFEGTLSAANRTAVRGYLTGRYGL